MGIVKKLVVERRISIILIIIIILLVLVIRINPIGFISTTAFGILFSDWLCLCCVFASFHAKIFEANADLEGKKKDKSKRDPTGRS